MKKPIILILFMLFAGINIANASRNVRLEFYDQIYGSNNPFGGSNKILLKQALRQQHGNINLRSVDLRSVRLVAKSRNGRGEAFLKVGRQTSRTKQVLGTPRGFQNSNRRTFYNLRFRNLSNSSQGAWQLHIRGRVKVRAVILTIDDTPTPGIFSLSANCDADSQGNFFRPRVDVECDIRGRGAVSYDINIGNITLWSGRLNPRRAFQRFKTLKRRVIAGRLATFTIILYDRRGRQTAYNF